MLTAWHVLFIVRVIGTTARDKQYDKMVFRVETGSPIGTEGAAFDSPLRQQDVKVGSAKLCIK